MEAVGLFIRLILAASLVELAKLLTIPERPSGRATGQPVRKNGTRGMTEMGVGGYSKGRGQNPTRGTPPTGMFGQLMGREDLAAHSKFSGKKGGKGKGRAARGRRGSGRGTKKPGY